MRLNRIAGKALVVLAMGLMGWFSPTSAEAPRDYWCDIWLCVEMEEYCDEEVISIWCSQACPPASEADCDRENCDPGETNVKCIEPG